MFQTTHQMGILWNLVAFHDGLMSNVGLVMLYNRGLIELFGFGFSLYIEWFLCHQSWYHWRSHFSQPPLCVPWRNSRLGWIYPWFFKYWSWWSEEMLMGVSLNHPRFDCFGLNKPNTAGVRCPPNSINQLSNHSYLYWLVNPTKKFDISTINHIAHI